MNAHDLLSEDGTAILLLCSAFGAKADRTGEDPAPYTLAEWNQLARKIQSSVWRRPGALAGKSADELAQGLGVPSPESERIVRLLERGGRVALEMENPFSRGMWVVTRVDDRYPARLRESLKHQAPTVLFGAGDIDLLQGPGIAVVGSRDIDEAGQNFAREIGRRCAQAGVPVVSGAARGTDSLAMEAAIGAGGKVFGVLANSLERVIRQADLRQLLLDGRLVFLTPYTPTAGFSVGAAMGRNKVIYGLAEAGVVVSSDFEKGGTWAGAVEALKAGWCPLAARAGAGVPKGNSELIRKGAMALEQGQLAQIDHLPAWLRESGARRPAKTDSFAMPPRKSGVTS
jgi:DNA processing protein